MTATTQDLLDSLISRSVKSSLEMALKDSKVSVEEWQALLRRVAVGGVNKKEYRDLKLLILILNRFGKATLAKDLQSWLNRKVKLSGPFRFYNGTIEKVTDLTETKLIGNGACAQLVQYYSRVGSTWHWREGVKVKGNRLRVGTAIATFELGIYPNQKHGNHAAFYVSQDATGITVVEQFHGLPSPQKRKLKFKGMENAYAYKDPSNNGDAFFAIMKGA